MDQSGLVLTCFREKIDGSGAELVGENQSWLVWV